MVSIIGSAVNYAHDRFYAVGSQARFKRADNGYAAAHGAFKHKISIVQLRQRKQLPAVFCQHILVGRNNIFSVLQRRSNIFLRRMLTPNQLNNNINVRVIYNIFKTIGNGIFFAKLRRFLRIAHQYFLYFYFAACFFGNFAAVMLKHMQHAAADGSHAQKADINTIFHLFPP